MRGATALLVRFVLSLVIGMAFWPAQANGMACAAPEPAPIAAVTKTACDMPCCRDKAMACGMEAAKPLACCQPKAILQALAHELSKVTAACPCEFGSVPNAPVALEKAVVQGAVVAILPPSLPEPAVWLSFAEPGICGVDSGPPLGTVRRNASSRAPPVARV
ncbi:hypothetical protein BH11ARM2_BH11ARM2_37710 [soil metagenome]